MSETAALEILRFLLAAFPPLAQILARYLPSGDTEPLVGKVRAILPVEGASTGVRKKLESDAITYDLDEEDP